MWEAIRSNQRRSRILISLLAVVMVALGAIIGMTVDPEMGGPMGALAALGLFLIMLLVAMQGGSAIVLSAAGAHQIQKDDSPRLWNVVEEMTIAAGMPKMPAVYIIDDDSPNAFAVGRKPEIAAVAVTSGLLKRLTRDELQGVVAHEIGHIRNFDTRFMTLAAVMVGTVTLLGEVFLRSLRFRGSGRRSSRDGGGQAEAIIFLVAILAAILAPIFAQLLYFACSRRREYLADASSARFTRYPEGLASALEKIALGTPIKAEISRVVAPMYIINPLQAHSAYSLNSTHPPTELRIKVLRAMGGRAGLSDYEAAFAAATAGKGGALGHLTLAEADSIQARPPSPEPEEPRADAIDRAREVQGVFGRVAQLLVLPCPCGVTIKIPPEYKGESIACPRCGRVHEVPRAGSGSESQSGSGVPPSGGTEPAIETPQILNYQRRQPGAWESFRCSCGQHIQLSPILAAPHVTCPRCHRTITIESQ